MHEDIFASRLRYFNLLNMGGVIGPNALEYYTKVFLSKYDTDSVKVHDEDIVLCKDYFLHHGLTIGTLLQNEDIIICNRRKCEYGKMPLDNKGQPYYQLIAGAIVYNKEGIGLLLTNGSSPIYTKPTYTAIQGHVTIDNYTLLRAYSLNQLIKFNLLREIDEETNIGDLIYDTGKTLDISDTSFCITPSRNTTTNLTDCRHTCLMHACYMPPEYMSKIKSKEDKHEFKFIEWSHLPNLMLDLDTWVINALCNIKELRENLVYDESILNE